MTKKNPLEKGGNLEQSTGDGAWERNNGGGRGRARRKKKRMGKGGGIREGKRKAENYAGYFPVLGSRSLSILLHPALCPTG